MSFRAVDRIPWPVVAGAGVIGALVLARYLELNLRRR